jgi:hypothetical protein
MERIAETLNVNDATISRDLEGFCTVQKPPRPKGGDAPKSSGMKTKRSAPSRSGARVNATFGLLLGERK